MSDGGASRVLDNLLAALVDVDDDAPPGNDDAPAIVDETKALIERLHRARIARQLAKGGGQ